MRLWKSTFGKSLPRVCVAGVMVSTLLALLAVGTGQVLAADFYVGGDGASDGNPGTASEPFATIQKAATVATAGSTVRIRTGIYRETIIPSNSGSEGKPIIFEPDGDAVVTVSGADTADGAWTQHDGHIYGKTMAMTQGYNAYMTDNTTLMANRSCPFCGSCPFCALEGLALSPTMDTELAGGGGIEGILPKGIDDRLIGLFADVEWAVPVKEEPRQENSQITAQRRTADKRLNTRLVDIGSRGKARPQVSQ